MTNRLRRGIVFFWAAYFTLVLATNTTDALKALGVLPDSFAFASGNYALMHRVTRIFDVPDAGVALLFAGVLVWEAAAALLFWRAVAAQRIGDLHARASAALLVGGALWAAFILADELLIAFEIPGLESTHVALLSLTLLSLLAVQLRLERPPESPDAAP